jgi:hypothetical protein
MKRRQQGLALLESLLGLMAAAAGLLVLADVCLYSWSVHRLQYATQEAARLAGLGLPIHARLRELAGDATVRTTTVRTTTNAGTIAVETELLFRPLSTFVFGRTFRLHARSSVRRSAAANPDLTEGSGLVERPQPDLARP